MALRLSKGQITIRSYAKIVHQSRFGLLAFSALRIIRMATPFLDYPPFHIFCTEPGLRGSAHCAHDQREWPHFFLSGRKRHSNGYGYRRRFLPVVPERLRDYGGNDSNLYGIQPR